MKRLYLLAVLALLSGCLVVETPNVPTPVPTEPALGVLTATYETNYSANGQPVVCDNRQTQIAYRFRYEGRLESWSSYLRGETLGTVEGERTFTPGSVGVSPYETAGYEVTYNLPPNVTPYATGAEEQALSPEAIVVVPVPNPTVIGRTRLYLVLRGANGESRPFVSQPIPVLINCP